MKRTITLLTALALVFAGSCQRIEETFVQDGLSLKKNDL